MIMKNEIPILEFDTDASAVIMPTHENLNLNLPKKAVFAFLGEHIDEYAKTHEQFRSVSFYQQRKTTRYMSSNTREKMCVYAKHLLVPHLQRS